MAQRTMETHRLYGHGARDIDRVKAGYRPKPKETNSEPHALERLFYSILGRFLFKKEEPRLEMRPPKGDPESYEVYPRL